MKRSFFDWLLGREPEQPPAELPTLHVPEGRGWQPGDRYDGPAAWFDGPEVGFVRSPYALDAEGRNLRVPLLRLTSVDDGHEGDGNWHYEIAGPNDYPQRGRVVPLETRVVGRTEVQA